MKGTEKQIRWAEEIKGIVLDTLRTYYDAFINDPRFDINSEKCVETERYYKSLIEKAEAEERAWFFIELFSNIDKNAQPARRLSQIRAAINVSPIGKEWR